MRRCQLAGTAASTGCLPGYECWVDGAHCRHRHGPEKTARGGLQGWQDETGPEQHDCSRQAACSSARRTFIDCKLDCAVRDQQQRGRKALVKATHALMPRYLHSRSNCAVVIKRAAAAAAAVARQQPLGRHCPSASKGISTGSEAWPQHAVQAASSGGTQTIHVPGTSSPGSLCTAGARPSLLPS